MGLFKNEVGRPSNETIKKRNIFKVICFILVLIIFGLVVVLLNEKGIIEIDQKQNNKQESKTEQKEYKVSDDLEKIEATSINNYYIKDGKLVTPNDKSFGENLKYIGKFGEKNTYDNYKYYNMAMLSNKGELYVLEIYENSDENNFEYKLLNVEVDKKIKSIYLLKKDFNEISRFACNEDEALTSLYALTEDNELLYVKVRDEKVKLTNKFEDRFVYLIPHEAGIGLAISKKDNSVFKFKQDGTLGYNYMYNNKVVNAKYVITEYMNEDNSSKIYIVNDNDEILSINYINDTKGIMEKHSDKLVSKVEFTENDYPFAIIKYKDGTTEKIDLVNTYYKN